MEVGGGELRLLPLVRDHFPLVATWLDRPHVARWWDNQGAVEEEFGPCVDGTDPTLVFIAALSGSPAGLIQLYRLADNPEYERIVGVPQSAGIDLLIGDEQLCGRGLGVRLIACALGAIWTHFPEVTSAVAGPSVRNLRSVRAFEKAGFVAVRRVAVPGEVDDELVLVCSRPTGP